MMDKFPKGNKELHTLSPKSLSFFTCSFQPDAHNGIPSILGKYEGHMAPTKINKMVRSMFAIASWVGDS